MYKLHRNIAAGWLALVFVLSFAAPAASQEKVNKLEEAAEIEVAADVLEFASPYLYLLAEPGLLIYDLSVPSAPEQIGVYATDLEWVDMALEGDRVYAMDRQSAYVLDVSSPVSPTLVAQVEVGTTATPSHGLPGIAVEDNILYVLGTIPNAATFYNCELRTYDLSDPDAMQTLDADSIAGAKCAGNLSVQDKTVYFSTISALTHGGCCHGVVVADISDDGTITRRNSVGGIYPDLVMAPASDGTIYLAMVEYDPQRCSGSSGYTFASLIRTFPSADASPSLSPPRLYVESCKFVYTTLDVAGNRLYTVSQLEYASENYQSQISAYERQGPEQEEFLVSHRFAGTSGMIAATEELVLIQIRDEERILVLRWVEEIIDEHMFLPISHNGVVSD